MPPMYSSRKKMPNPHHEIFRVFFVAVCPSVESTFPPPLPSSPRETSAHAVGAGFIFRLPPVSWTLTNRRV
jgi:hypothetical protein